jgi:hypothetical protein
MLSELNDMIKDPEADLSLFLFLCHPDKGTVASECRRKWLEYGDIYEMTECGLRDSEWRDTHEICQNDDTVECEPIIVCKEVINKEKRSWKGKRFLKIKPMILSSVTVKKRKLD